MKTIGLVMLGVAHPHAIFWGTAWARLPYVRLMGVWDREPQRAREWGAQFHVPVCETLAQALQTEGVKAVAICAENVYHAELTIAAAQRGLHILCEKPTATTLEDCDRMLAAVERTGVRYMQGFAMRVDPVNDTIEELLRSGVIGQVTAVRKRHGNGWAAQHQGRVPQVMQWFVDPKYSGGGALLDEGIHGMDFLNRLFGRPLQVQALIPPSATGLSVEDNASVLLQFPGNVPCVFQTGWTFQAGDNTTEIFGTHGTILQRYNDCASTAVNDGYIYPLKVYSDTFETPGWQMPRIPTNFHQIHELVANRFVDCLRDSTPFPSSLQDGRTALEMVLLAYRAAQNNQTVTFA